MQSIQTRSNLLALAHRVSRLYAKSFIFIVILAISTAILYPTSEQTYTKDYIRDDSRYESKLVVKNGDTFSSLLAGFDVSDSQTKEIFEVSRPVYDLRKLQIGQVLRMHYTMELDQKIIQSMSFKLDSNRELEIYRDSEEFKLKEVFIPLKKNIVKLSATIESSMLGAAAKAGIPAKALADAISAYSYSVDFQRDIQPNDTINVLLESFTTEDGKFSHHGKVIYSSLNLSGVEHKIYRYTLQDGTEEFISEDYSTMRRSLLKTPVPVTKISSKFGMRKHPVLGYSKMHKGIDFAAPIGTPIYAAGSGEVMEAGWKGAYGQYIRIKHNSELATAYAHIKGFASDVKKGSKIKQGQVIGYVGVTGRSTGPHLHYEVLVKGKHVNPLSIKSTPEKKLSGSELDKFKLHKHGLDNMVRES